jgi:hypothetical protein
MSESSGSGSNGDATIGGLRQTMMTIRDTGDNQSRWFGEASNHAADIAPTVEEVVEALGTLAAKLGLIIDGTARTAAALQPASESVQNFPGRDDIEGSDNSVIRTVRAGIDYMTDVGKDQVEGAQQVAAIADSGSLARLRAAVEEALPQLEQIREIEAEKLLDQQSLVATAGLAATQIADASETYIRDYL